MVYTFIIRMFCMGCVVCGRGYMDMDGGGGGGGGSGLTIQEGRSRSNGRSSYKSRETFFLNTGYT